MSKGCSKCGTPNADDVRFCRACGTAFDTAPEVAAPAEAPCRACGHPIRPGARFCTQCGADQTPPVPVQALSDVIAPLPVEAAPASPLSPSAQPTVARTRRTLGVWIGLAAIVVALAGGAAWWLGRSPTPALPTFDAAPPPSVLGASGATASASAAPTPSAAAASSLWEPIDDTPDALPEQPVRALVPASAPQAPRSVAARSRTSAPATAAAPAATRTVQAHCSNRNPILQGICESRECARTEHAGELVCQRVKAAEERRRQQEGGG